MPRIPGRREARIAFWVFGRAPEGRVVHPNETPVRGQHRLGFDPAFEPLVQSFDGLGDARSLPLADGQPGEDDRPPRGCRRPLTDIPEVQSSGGTGA